MFSRVVRTTKLSLTIRQLRATLQCQTFTPESCRALGTTTVRSNKQIDHKSFIKQEPTYLIFPEISDDTVAQNEFLQIPQSGRISFDAMNVEKIVKASGKLSIEFEHFIDDLSQSLRTEFADQDVSNAKLQEFITEMEAHLLPLNYNLNLLNSFRIIRRNEYNFTTFDDFFRARYSKAKLRFLDRQIYCFMCEMKARREFFEEKSTQDSENEKQINFEQRQKNEVVDRYIREAKLMGQSLKHQDQANVYRLINEKLAQEQVNYVNTTLQATAHFQSNIISPQFLDCLPDHVITQINHHDAPSVFHSFMRYCPDQNLRKDFWLSYSGRGAPYMGSNLNNFRTIETIRDLRYRKARLLGYDNFAAMSIDLRGAGGQTMASTVENVRAFIQGLGVRSEKQFAQNMKELEGFAIVKPPPASGKSNKPAPLPLNSVDQLNLWDLKYFERLFLRDQFRIDSRDVRAHFPLDRVFSGMLGFVENLFGLKIVEVDRDDDNKPVGWGPNARLFKVFSNNNKSMAEIGSFYFDPFQRESRIFMPISRCESLQTKPLAFFLMNFASGSSIFDQFEKKEQLRAPEKETLLNFDQVVDIFGKFGFVLQHLLTEVKFSEINSLYNVEADAFHLVSHFMRFWPLNSYEVIKNCSGHFETGDVMPEEFFQRIRKAYYHFSSINLKHDLYLMALDLNLHTTKEHTSSVQKSTWNEYMAPFKRVEEDGHLCALMDVFSGNGLESISYSNKWSEVIAADVFDAFRSDSPTGLKSPEQVAQLGERFRETFLANTGAVSTNELFRRFRGRDPTLDGYLSINGLE